MSEDMEERFRTLLEEAVCAFPQFDWNMDLPPGAMEVEADVNGGDLVEWFSTWREEVRTALGITARMRPPETVMCCICLPAAGQDRPSAPGCVDW